MADTVSDAVKLLVVEHTLHQNQNPVDSEVKELVDLVGVTTIRMAARVLGMKDNTFVTVGTTEGKYSLKKLAAVVSTANNDKFPVSEFMNAKDATAFDGETGKITNNADKAVFSNFTGLIKFLAGITAASGCHNPLDVTNWGPLTNITSADDKKRLLNFIHNYYITSAKSLSTLKDNINALGDDEDLPDASFSTASANISADEKSVVELYIALRGNGASVPVTELSASGVIWQTLISMTSPKYSGTLKPTYTISSTAAISFIGNATQEGTGEAAESKSDDVTDDELRAMHGGDGPFSTYAVLFKILKNKFSLTDADFKTLIADNIQTYGTQSAFSDLCATVPSLKNETLVNRMAKFRTTKGIAPSGDFVTLTETQDAVLAVLEQNSEMISPVVPGEQPVVPTKQFGIPKPTVKVGSTVADTDLADFARKNTVVGMSKNNTDTKKYGAGAFTHAKFLTGANATSNATKYAKLFSVNDNNEVVAKLDGLAYAFSTLFSGSAEKSKILDALIPEDTKRLAVSLKESSSGTDGEVIALIKSLLESGISLSTLALQSSGNWSNGQSAVVGIVNLLFDEIDNGRSVNSKIESFLTHTNANLASVRTGLSGLTADNKARLLRELVIRNKGSFPNLGPMFSAVEDDQLDIVYQAMEAAGEEYTSGFKAILRKIPFSKVLAKFGAIKPDVNSGIDGALTSRDYASESWIQCFTDASGLKLIAENTSTPAHYILSYSIKQKVYNSSTQKFETDKREKPMANPNDVKEQFGLTQEELVGELEKAGIAVI